MVGCSHHTMGLLRGGGDPGSVQPSTLLVLLLPDLAHPDAPTLLSYGDGTPIEPATSLRDENGNGEVSHSKLGLGGGGLSAGLLPLPQRVPGSLGQA